MTNEELNQMTASKLLDAANHEAEHGGFVAATFLTPKDMADYFNEMIEEQAQQEDMTAEEFAGLFSLLTDSLVIENGKFRVVDNDTVLVEQDSVIEDLDRFQVQDAFHHQDAQRMARNAIDEWKEAQD